MTDQMSPLLPSSTLSAYDSPSLPPVPSKPSMARFDSVGTPSQSSRSLFSPSPSEAHTLDPGSAAASPPQAPSDTPSPRSAQGRSTDYAKRNRDGSLRRHDKTSPYLLEPPSTGSDHQTPVAGHSSGISLVFKVPPGSARNEKERDADAESSSSVAGSGKKRRKVEIPPTTRTSRSRATSPHGSKPELVSLPTPALTSARGRPSTGTPGAAAPPVPSPLDIFTPPVDPPLPEALQSVLSSSSRSRRVSTSSSAKGKNGDTPASDVPEVYESRLRSRNRDKDSISAIKSGVSASGRGVKVGSTAKEAGRVIKHKNRNNVDIPNQDFCSACRGIGKFLCCDGCPRSFHFMCLEPPLRVDELPKEEIWYCKKCNAERSHEQSPPLRDKEAKPILSVFKQLSKRVDSDNPSAFKLPLDIRQFFAGIGTDGKGNYVDAEETRTKYDRKGFQEERDGTRLRDGRARPVSCYVCGGSSIPIRSRTTEPESTWRQIVSCDYCALHWHLDCLSPPLTTMPNSGRKWMCPNHAEQVAPRRRTIRTGIETVEIQGQHMPNNGNITVVAEPELRPVIDCEDMIINKRKYRVPERIIRLDFWDKIKEQRIAPALSDASSVTSSDYGDIKPTEEDIDAANLLFSLMQAPTPTTATTTGATPAEDVTRPVSPDSLESAPPRPNGTSRRANGHAESRKDQSTPKITLRMPRASRDGRD